MFRYVLKWNTGRDSSVSIATRYGLDSPGIESWWRRDFPHLSRPALEPTQPYIQWVPRISRGQSGRGVDQPHTSSAEIKERVELYLYSPSGPSWLFLGWLYRFLYILKLLMRMKMKGIAYRDRYIIHCKTCCTYIAFKPTNCTITNK